MIGQGLVGTRPDMTFILLLEHKATNVLYPRSNIQILCVYLLGLDLKILLTKIKINHYNAKPGGVQ